MSELATATESPKTEGGPVSHARTRPVDPLRSVAHQYRLRCYRDACGDWSIPGWWGEIFWYGSARDGLPDRIGVQIGGPRANGYPTRTTEKGGNLRINRLMDRCGPPSPRGDGEAVFVLPADRILEAASATGTPPTPGVALQGHEATAHSSLQQGADALGTGMGRIVDPRADRVLA